MSISAVDDVEDEVDVPEADPPPIWPIPPGGGPMCFCVDPLEPDASLDFMSDSTELILLSSVAKLLSLLVDDAVVEVLLDDALRAVNTEVRPLSMFDLPCAASLADVELPLGGPPGGGPPAPAPPWLPLASGPLANWVRKPASAAELDALVADELTVLLVLVEPVVPVDDVELVELDPAFSIVFWRSWTRVF